jgi:hydrogenase-4 component F
MILVGLVAAVPFLAAALLPFVPARAGAWVGLGAAVLAFGLVCRLALVGGADALGTVLALVAAFVGVTTAWFAVHDIAHEKGARVANALFQAVLGAALLAALADNLGVGWIALEVGAVAAAAATALPGTAAAVEAGWRAFIVGGVALALALFGIVVLTLAALPSLGPGPGEAGWAAMSWSGLARAAPGAQPALVNLAFCLLLVGWGTLAALVPLHGWMPSAQAEGPVAVSGILATLLLNAALANLLRLRGVMAACPGAAAMGTALVALGLASVLGGALMLWPRREARRFLAMSTVGQGGLTAVAFGLGGTAIFAGLLHLVLHTLAKAALLQGAGRAALARGGLWRTDRALAALVLAAGISVAGLPPAGVFASEFLVLAEAMRQAPVVASMAGVGVVIGAWAVIVWLQGVLLGPAAPSAAPPTGYAALLGAWVNLALALALALAMPGPVLALLRAAAR